MKIEIIANPSLETTAEYHAATVLKEMLLSSAPKDVKGQIMIASNVSLQVQPARDIDLVVCGNLSNCVLSHFYCDEANGAKKDLQVKDFFLVIELKSHPADNVCCKDSRLFVNYANEIKDITAQSEDQRFSMTYFLQQSCNATVRVTNAIWFNSINKDELNKMTSNRYYGALPNEFDFKDFIATIIEQGLKPTRDMLNERYVISAGIDSDELDRTFLKLFK